ncbi:MAG: MurR/RpiR family transcriptional regulator [Intestinibacter sp.]|uniref:MurR/RpiR family transcriptional regulator n=1 Tax=Intestinibacter sp. TaxID=1965304 RepID=UPI003F156AB2
MAIKVTDILFSMYEDFFDAEKKIADYILANKEKVVDMTVAELARESNTSDATVSRFCKKCNLKGFHHLKITLAKELSDNDIDIVKSNNIDVNNISQSLENILANKIEELTQTVRMMDEATMSKILDLFKNAECVQFAAVGNTIPVALDGAYKFNQLGIKSVALSIWETQLGYTLNAGEKDVIVIISNSGASKQLVNLAKVAKKNNATVIGITNSENSPIAKLSDYHIATATRERLFVEEYCFSRISAMTVIEIFYLLLVSSSENSKAAIRKHEELIADDKI